VSPSSGSAALLILRPYPAVILLYGSGAACLANGNYQFRGEMLRLRVRAEWNGNEVPIVEALNGMRVLRLDDQRKLPGYENQPAPLSDHLFFILREPLREFIPDDRIYEETFDWFEYILGLIYCDVTTSDQALATLKAKGEWAIRAPWGRFAWKGLYADVAALPQKADLRQGQPHPPHIGGLLQQGFFGSHGRYVDLKRGFDAHVVKILSGY
jgi:hypothetical protein